MSSNFDNLIGNNKLQQAYDVAVEKRISKVTQKANSAIKSFAELVDEINRLQNESKGTTIKKEVTAVGTDMSNSMVMVTRMLEAQLQTLHGIVRPDVDDTQEKEITQQDESKSTVTI